MVHSAFVESAFLIHAFVSSVLLIHAFVDGVCGVHAKSSKRISVWPVLSSQARCNKLPNTSRR